jgi:hypothetical protein
MVSLEAVLTQMQDCGINVWVGTAPPGHIAACVAKDGNQDVRRFHTVDGQWPMDDIARWLRKTACEMYPECAPKLRELGQ